MSSIKIRERERAQELQDAYDACCAAIEVSSMAICMGANVEYNRQNNARNEARIRAIRKEADKLGVTLLLYKERYMRG